MRTTTVLPHAARRVLPALAALAMTALVLLVPTSAQAAGPYVFCDRDFPAHDTCVGGGGHVLVETQARDLNGSNGVCATQKNGSSTGSANQYAWACGVYLVGRVNTNGYFGYPAVRNDEAWSQIMRGQFYL